MSLVDLARRARLRALVVEHLSNSHDVWRAYRGGDVVPPLRFRNGLVLLHGPGDAPLFLFFEIFANGCYRRHFDGPAPDETIVDIGANIGAFTLDCAARFPSARIDAYEPDPRAFDMLTKNVTANRLEDRVRVYAEAVGRAPGVLSLTRGDGSIVATGYPRASETTTGFVDCRMVDLRTVLDRARGLVGVVKVDVEGAEADIIEGGGQAIRSAAQFVGECHEDRVPDVVARCRSAFDAARFAFAISCTRRCGPLFRARRID